MAEKYYKLTPPPDLGKAFFATYQIRRDGVRVFSTRDGKWKLDEKINFADLDSPHFEYADWDIVPVSKEAAPPLSEGEPFYIDILQMEVDQNLPHWLDPRQRDPERFEAIRARVREKYRSKARVKDFNPYHEPGGSPKGGQFAKGSGTATAESNYGLVPGDAEKFKTLKIEWAQVNNELLEHIDKPDGPEAQSKMRKLESIVQGMQSLRADPGTPAGIGLPGGPRDVIIVGAGPGGLAASINGAAEGLDTLVVEANVVAGGQAKFSSRIENFPGFPVGVTGERLTKSMYEQAKRLGAETKLGIRVISMTHDEATGLKRITLSDGQTIESRTVILAGGVEFRRLTFPGSEGPGVIVGDGKALAKEGKGGNVVVVGGSNGAAQAALGVATTANRVYLMARSSIIESMSDYQVAAVRANSKITVIEGDSIAKMNRDDKNQPVSVETVKGSVLEIKAVGAFIGSVPETKWVSEKIQRDKGGRIRTNDDLETHLPGVYAIGDMREGAIGRIGIAVGEGQLALRQANVYLDLLRKKFAGGGAAMTDSRAPKTSPLITDLFALDRDNPWFGQTVEGIEPPKKEKAKTQKEKAKALPPKRPIIKE